MNKPIQQIAAVAKIAKAHNLSIEATNQIIDASAKAQANLRIATENINYAFDELRKAKACVENYGPHDHAYKVTLDAISFRLRQLRALVDSEEGSVFAANYTWISGDVGLPGVDHSVIEK